jgi:glycerophosphoryl diester phosphodiesterase
MLAHLTPPTPMRRSVATGLAATFIGLCAAACTPRDASTPWPAPTLGGRPPIVIAHRGASGERPEHTLVAYERAIAQGADCIEPDLVLTKDGVLVARHDIYLSTTTDVADHPEFASRRRLATDEGHRGLEDWFVADFTFAELRTLRARQAFKGRSSEFDGRYEIPTFDEVLQLAARSRTTTGARLCVYPEAKAPAFHASLEQDIGGAILAALHAHGLDAGDAPVFIQSFEPTFVREMAARTSLPLILLAGDTTALAAAQALEGAPFWDGLGVTHAMLFDSNGASSGLVEAAHAAGTTVHVWTYRDDAPFRSDESTEAAMRRALALGVDGVFSDFPATAVRVVDEMRTGAPLRPTERPTRAAAPR